MFRWLALAVFITALAVSARLRALARRETGTIPRSRESPALIAGRLVVALPLFGSVIAYLISPRSMAWASLGLSPLLRWLGVALGIVAVPTVYWVLSTLGSNVSETVLTKERHELVTSGPYRFVRHPLYVVGICLFLSVGLMAANAFILLWTLLTLIAVRSLVVPREEAELVAKFGEDYRRYQKMTGSLLPKLPHERTSGGAV
jgi:protein-S-isoprenylcysteine O-methyltransferase Ste14